MKNKTQRIAIFGGSFDPPHYGHYDIVKNLEKYFDRVIVVPSYVSPFKTGASDAAIRYKLCKKLFESQKTEVSRREIKKREVSYSIDTAKHFAKKYAGEKLYWVIGSEELTRLVDWRDIDALKTLVEFYVVPRPNFVVDDAAVKALKKRKIKIKLAKFAGLDVSSTRVKIDMAFGKPNSYMPSAVYKCAVENDVFDPYGKYVDALYKYGLNENRIVHTYRVTLRGVELAKKYGANVNDTVIACILHDVAKSVDIADYAGKADITGFPQGTEHAPIGAYIAKREFDVSDEIARAIYSHSNGDGDMSVLGEIVYLADKTEDGRKYKSLYYLRRLCELDKDLAMLYALTEICGLRDYEANEHSGSALEHYEKLCVGKEFPEKSKLSAMHSNRLPMVRAKAELGEIKSKAVRAVPDKSLRPVTDVSKYVSTDARHDKSDAYDARLIAKAVAAELSLHKAHDIDVIELGDKTIIADYFVIASATSSTAVKALYGYVEDRLTKQFGLDPSKRDVDKEWVALDYGGVIVHIFTDETREFYNIERLWADGKNITRYGD